MANTNRGSGRGFASMDPQRQREIASQGGRAAHASGNAHEFTSAEAQAAGARSHINRQQQQQGAQAQQAGGANRMNVNKPSGQAGQSSAPGNRNQHR